MTPDEHAAARACGVTPERGMTGWVAWYGPAGEWETERALVENPDDEGEIAYAGDLRNHCAAGQFAPAFDDLLTYLGALRQWWQRATGPGQTRSPNASELIRLLTTPDPARLAALLRETAPEAP